MADDRVEPPAFLTEDRLPVIRVQFEESGPFGTQAEETTSPFEEPGVFFNTAEQQSVFDDFVGTPGTDFVQGESQDGASIVLEGGDGEDRLTVVNGPSTILGGTGDDDLENAQPGGLIRGGSGDDVIGARGPGEVRGDGGNNTLRAEFGFGEIELAGGSGDDVITAFGDDATVFGNAGDDMLNTRSGATGFGGDGDDQIQVDMASAANGGAGNDTIEAWDRPDTAPGAAILTGGAGTDLFDIRPDNPTPGQTVEFVRITDFDPSEDVLQVGLFRANGFVSGIEIVPPKTAATPMCAST